MSTPFERCLDMLGDVPGEDLEAKLTTYIGCYMALQIEVQELRVQVEQLSTFVRQIAECEMSDNQNIRRAKDLLAAASTNQPSGSEGRSDG